MDLLVTDIHGFEALVTYLRAVQGLELAIGVRRLVLGGLERGLGSSWRRSNDSTTL